MDTLTRRSLLLVLFALGACDSPTGPEGARTMPVKPRHDIGGECYWIGYGAGYLCPGLIAVAAPYSPPDPPYGGAYHTTVCEGIEYMCTYDPAHWLADASGYTDTGGAPDGFPPELYVDLNGHERQLVWQHPLEAVRVYLAERDAEQWSQQQTSDGPHNGMQDAFRHTMWNCLMTISIGADGAKMFADAHEESSENALETAMDLQNNAVGREIAGYPSTTCATEVWNAWDQNRLMILE